MGEPRRFGRQVPQERIFICSKSSHRAGEVLRYRKIGSIGTCARLNEVDDGVVKYGLDIRIPPFSVDLKAQR